MARNTKPKRRGVRNVPAKTIMLGIAREAILTRASQDGYAPDDYDPASDEEGYIISLLNALMQWTHEHGINWIEDLTRARGFFEEDLVEAECDGVRLPEPTIQELRCPACGYEGCFEIEVSQRLLMFRDGVVLHGRTGEEWGNWSHCLCHHCLYKGMVYDFRQVNRRRKEIKSNG